MTIKRIKECSRQRRISLRLISCAAELILAITFFASTSSAQTIVCSGDSVVIVLDGHKQGLTLWQQSSDLNSWSDASGNKYNDSLVFIAANTLYYRAIVTDGTCSPYYSYVAKITVRPVSPVANPASGITLISFDANWSAVDGATTYYVDVASDTTFTSFISGYKNLQVNNKQVTSAVSGLRCDTNYYYRVRAYDDSCGAISSNSNTIIVRTPACPVYCSQKSTCDGKINDSRDNKIYKTVQIGTQCWMAENLNIGTAIPGDAPQTPGIIEKYCYDDVAANCATYGGLYLWHEMMGSELSDSVAPGPQGICPAGWHIPTDGEWKCLEMNLGTVQGGQLKDTTTVHWINPNKGATNSSGFTALPGGKHSLVPRDSTFGGLHEPSYVFWGLGRFGYWWSATEYKAGMAWLRQLGYDYAGVSRIYDHMVVTYPPYEFEFPTNPAVSIRCVKD